MHASNFIGGASKAPSFAHPFYGNIMAFTSPTSSRQPSRGYAQGSKLWNALRLNLPAEAARLIADGASATERVNGGLTPLMVVAKLGFVECAQAVLPFSDMAAVDGYGRSALSLAAGGCAGPAMVELLLSAGPEQALIVDILGDSPLLRAASQRKAECVLALLPHGGARLAGSLGRTALMECARLGMGACVEALLPASDVFAVDSSGKTAKRLAKDSGFHELAVAIQGFEAKAYAEAEAESLLLAIGGEPSGQEEREPRRI